MFHGTTLRAPDPVAEGQLTFEERSGIALHVGKMKARVNQTLYHGFKPLSPWKEQNPKP